MYVHHNDARLLVFLAVAFVIGAAAAALGIARFTVATTITGPLHANVAAVVEVFGYFGWYFALMYGFARPGFRRALSIAVPGSIVALVAYWGVLRDLHPAEGQGVLLFGTLGFALGYPSLAKMLYDRYISECSGAYRAKLAAILFTCLGVAILGLTSQAYLDIVTSLHPATYDPHLYHFEATLGFQPSVVLARLAEELPWLRTVLVAAYNVMPVTFGMLYGAQVARAERPSVSLLAAFVVSVVFALIGFNLMPATGPRYLLSGFPDSAVSADEIPLVATQLAPYLRNGMPSLHFGWALLLWLNARLLGNRWLSAFFGVLLLLNFVATMGLGEHYLIDLVVAIPMIVVVQALLMGSLPWAGPRKHAAVGGLAVWAAWLVALRFGVPFFETIPGLSWLAIAATVVASVRLYAPLANEFMRIDVRALPVATPRSARQAFPVEARIVAIMFFISGFAGLMYEVVFSKSLALTFGSTATAMYTVLATYMGGMAIGAWLGGRLGSGRDNPLPVYAFCELAIGVYCAATPLIFVALRGSYVLLAQDVAPDAHVLTLYRVGLGMASLLIPTILMGMTLPILARFFEQRSYALGQSVAVLYAANTVGAALGALVVGYAVIPTLGIAKTTMASVLLSLTVAFVAFELHKRIVRRSSGRDADVEGVSRDPASQAPELDHASASRVALIALAALGVGGMVTLAAETIYIHLLAVVAGNSTYAFSLMLFTFLLGLGVGAEVARRLLRARLPLLLLLVWLEFGLALVILGGVYLWDSMPDYFASFAGYARVRDFASRETVRGLVCLLAMFPPAVFIGAIYPVAMECVGQAKPGRAIGALGRAAALNTAGNIIGVLAGGFVMLPTLGALRSIQLLALTCMVLGTIALLASPVRQRARAWAPAVASAILLAFQPASFNYDGLASGANVYFAAQGWGKIVDHAESIDGGLTSVAIAERPGLHPVRTLLTNGKFQGNDSQEGEMPAQLGFSLAPLLHTDRRERALVIGYGTGVSARTLYEAGYKEVDVVDLSSDIVRLADRHFSSVNAEVSRQPTVRTYITDGRNYLLLQDRKYDLIGMEISSIWFAGAASLYNREFYELTRRRLYPDGVLQQWVQLHHMAHEDVLRVLGSVRSEFRYVWLYLIGSQGIIVASNSPQVVPTQRNAEQLRRTPTLQPILHIFGKDPVELMDTQLLDPAGTDRLLNDFPVPARYWVSTDDNLFLEYSTPKGNVLDGKESLEENVRFIKAHSASK